MAYGAYENDILASTATVTEIVDNIALIRGVQTIPSQRSKGLATSAVSAIVQELISSGKDVILWVSKDNTPAMQVYGKIGFQKTEYALLSFKARKLSKKAKLA